MSTRQSKIKNALVDGLSPSLISKDIFDPPILKIPSLWDGISFLAKTGSEFIIIHMIPYLRNLRSTALKNKIALLRLDFNTADDWRIEASLPTIQFLLRHCRAVVILSHKGRPEKPAAALSLKKDSEKLAELIKKPVIFINHFRFPEIRKQIQNAKPKSIFILENLRFLTEESKNSPGLAKQLAALGDIYVNDAFAVSHRENASVTGITKFLPSYAGFELEKEIDHLSRVMEQPGQPLVVILGGAKIEKKLSIFQHLRSQAETFLIGGLLNQTILKIRDKKMILPVDLIKTNGIVKDIGRVTVKKFLPYIQSAKTIIWNGPVGDIEDARFRSGTIAIAKAVANNRQAFKIVGGGETIMFLKKEGLDKKMNFVSTGGGAMLEFLAGEKLPGIEALRK